MLCFVVCVRACVRACVCVCVCDRQTETKRDRDWCTDRQRQIESRTMRSKSHETQEPWTLFRVLSVLVLLTAPPPPTSPHPTPPHPCWLKCCFTSTETVGLLGTGAQDVHVDFHTAPDLCMTIPVQLLALKTTKPRHPSISPTVDWSARSHASQPGTGACR